MGADLNARSPFNDLVIASGSDDAKVKANPNSTAERCADGSRYSYGKSLRGSRYTLKKGKSLRMSRLLQSSQVTQGSTIQVRRGVEC